MCFAFIASCYTIPSSVEALGGRLSLAYEIFQKCRTFGILKAVHGVGKMTLGPLLRLRPVHYGASWEIEIVRAINCSAGRGNRLWCGERRRRPWLCFMVRKSLIEIELFLTRNQNVMPALWLKEFIFSRKLFSRQAGGSFGIQTQRQHPCCGSGDRSQRLGSENMKEPAIKIYWSLHPSF